VLGTTRDWAARWWRRLLRKPGDVRLVGATAHLNMTATADLTVIRGPLADGATTDDRVRRLEQVAEDLRREQAALRAQTLARTEQLARDLETARQALERSSEENRRALGDLAGGGLRLDAIGIACLVVGVTFTSTPNGVAHLLTSVFNGVAQLVQ
jgi:hypothetical protein